MKNKTNITVIIPVHTIKTKGFNEYMANALKSIENNKVLPEKLIIVAPKNNENIAEKITTIVGDSFPVAVEYVTNNGLTDFASQMNLGVSKVDTEFFSFLEFDDEYSDCWFNNVEKYAREYPEVSMFLPIISDANFEKRFLGYTNEVAWAFEFTDKHGVIDADILKEYPNFNPDGMVMRTSDFKRIGGYKKNIKLTFNLEFLLRACEQALQVMIIPKIGYQHTNMREESLFWDYKNGDNKLTIEESEFWMNAARQEFYYLDDRKIVYVPAKLEDNSEEKC